MKNLRSLINLNIVFVLLIAVVITFSFSNPKPVCAGGGPNCRPSNIDCNAYSKLAKNQAACLSACKNFLKASANLCNCLNAGGTCGAQYNASDTAFGQMLKACY